jgi:hypothetical protein
MNPPRTYVLQISSMAYLNKVAERVDSNNCGIWLYQLGDMETLKEILDVFEPPA